MLKLITVVVCLMMRWSIAQPPALSESNNVINDSVIAFQNPRPLGNEAPVDVLLKLTLLVIDIFTTASGSYFIVRDTDVGGYLNDDDEVQQQVIAIASTNLWMKLPHTIEMEEVFFNASQLTLSPLLLEAPNRMENIHNDLFNNIEVQIQANSSLYEIYNREKHRVEELDLPRLVQGSIDFRNIVPIYVLQKFTTMLNACPRLQYFIVHAQFASYARGVSLMSAHINSTVQSNYYAIAQSLLSLADESEIGQKVQDFYEKALRKTVGTMKRQLRSGNDVSGADQILFPEIEKVFSWEPELNAELSKMKKKFLEK